MLLQLSLQNEKRLPIFYKGSLCIVHQIALEVDDFVEVEEIVEDFLKDVHSEHPLCQDVIDACVKNFKLPAFTDHAGDFQLSWETLPENKTVTFKVINPNDLPLTHNGVQVGELNLSYKVISGVEAASVVGKVMNQFDSNNPDIEKWLENIYQGETSFSAHDGPHRYAYSGTLQLEWYIS